MANPTPSYALGGCELGHFGLGLSLYSPWAALYKHVPSEDEDERSIRTIIAAINSGVRLLDSATFYGHDHHGLKLLAKVIRRVGREKLVLSVKFGGKVTEKGMEHHVSRKDVRQEIETTLSVLGVDYVDIFVPARVTPETPIEETISELGSLVQEGKIKAIGLSEASAASIARASAVHPIACLQTEYGPMETDIERNGILEACQKHNVLVLAYGVLQHGFLSAKGLSPWNEFRDLTSRTFYPRFHRENYEHNQGLLRQLQAFIVERGLDISISALAVAWVIRRGLLNQADSKAAIMPLIGMRSIDSLTDNLKAVKFALGMSQQDAEALESMLRSFEIRGERYPPHVMKGVGL